MPKYRFVVELDADDDEEAREQAYGTNEHPEWGAQDKFSSIYSVRLTREDGTEVD